MKSMSSVVRVALANHLKCHPSMIRVGQRLERDLDLTPLELVLVALEVEELEGVHVPPSELTGLETVGDLLSLFARTAARMRRARAVGRVA